MDWAEVKLENLGGGAILERFQDALKEVIGNIVDPNFDLESTRGITINIKFKPMKNDDNQVAYSLSVKTQLAAKKSVNNFIFVGTDKGELKAYEQNVEQGNLFNNEKKIREINIKEGSHD